jgi:membrane fusion protein (multidrug efflux system)
MEEARVKSSLIVASILVVFSTPLQAQLDKEFGDELLPGLQSNVVRAQLVPLQKGAFSAGISAIVEHIYVKEGQEVAQGDRLLSFDCDRLAAAKRMADARIDQAEATLKVNRELLKLNSVGPLEVQLNQAELEIARGELGSVVAQLKHCEVKAPFAGAITMRAVEQYQFVAEGEPLLELVSRQNLEVSMLMPSTSLSWLAVGSDFRMLVEELNSPMSGKIVRIGGAVDPVSLTVQVYGVLDEGNDRLLPGMSGRVQFVDVEFE